MVCRPRRIYSPRRPHHLHLRALAGDSLAPRAAREVRNSTCTTGIWPHAAKVVISVVKRSSIEVVRGATTRSCFRLGIPSGHSSGSHSTARAISFTRHFPAVTGGGRRIQTGQEACSALQSRAGEVCTATAQTQMKGGSFLFCSRWWRLLWHGVRRNFSLPLTSRSLGGPMLLPAWLSTARSTPFSTDISGGTALCVNWGWFESRTSRDDGAVISSPRLTAMRSGTI